MGRLPRNAQPSAGAPSALGILSDFPCSKCMRLEKNKHRQAVNQPGAVRRSMALSRCGSKDFDAAAPAASPDDAIALPVVLGRRFSTRAVRKFEQRHRDVNPTIRLNDFGGYVGRRTGQPIGFNFRNWREDFQRIHLRDSLIAGEERGERRSLSPIALLVTTCPPCGALRAVADFGNEKKKPRYSLPASRSVLSASICLQCP